MFNFFTNLLGGRSNKWPTLRKKHLREYPKCSICNGIKKLEVHHCLPFKDFPNRELDPNNLITLCEKNNCHLMFGHLGDYKSYNHTIKEDEIIWNNKINRRKI